MFNLMGRTINSRLNFLGFVGTFNRNFHCISYPSQQVLCLRTHDSLKNARHNTQIQQCRNISLAEVSEFGLSVYRFVTTSDTSLQLKNALIEFHDYTGLPWWATIPLVATLVKFGISFPIGVFQQHTLTRVEFTRQELVKTFNEKIRPEVLLSGKRGKWKDDKIARHMILERRKLWKSLVVKNNCHPSKILILSLLQFPIWVLLSYTFRDLMDVNSMTVPVLSKLALQTEGVLWNTNLCLPDSTMILPFSLFLTSWLFIDISSYSSSSVGSLISKISRFLFRSFSVISIFIGLSAPAGLVLYWVSSLLLGMIIHLLFLAPKVRRILRIPITPREKPNPYSFLAKVLKEIYLPFLKKSTEAKT